MFRFAPASLLLLSACDADKSTEHTGSSEDPCAVTEVCNGLDDDCDGLTDDEDSGVDETTAPLWYEDLDGDGYGPGRTAVEACSSPYELGVLEGGDCQADDPAIHPGAEEICDGMDNDCDGTVDAGAEDGVVLYVDDDLDGFGVDGTESFGCEGAWGFAEQAGDCDDDEALSFPGAPEYCYDGVDQDCEGDGDGGCPTEVCGDIHVDTIWPASEDGYYVSCEIDVAATLTIEPGTTVWFGSNAGLEVGEFGAGALAIDAADDPVIFTSAVGRLDPSQTPAPGDWRGLLLSSGMDGTTIRGLEVWYAGGAGEDEDDLASGAIRVVRSDYSESESLAITMEDLAVQQSANAGVLLGEGSLVTLRRVELRDNQSVGVRVGDDAQDFTVKDSVFGGNGTWAMSMTLGQSANLDDSNSFEDGDGDVGLIELRGGHVSEDFRIPNPGQPYALMADITVWGEESPVLTVSDGVEMRFLSGLEITVGEGDLAGDLVVEGDSEGVLFGAQEGSRGHSLDLTRIGGASDLRGMTLQDAGQGSEGALKVGTSYVDGDPVELAIVNSVIDGSGATGIYVRCGVELLVSGTQITNSEAYGLFDGCGDGANHVLASDGVSPTFTDNVLSGNGAPAGLSVLDAGQLDPSSTFSGNDTDTILFTTNLLSESVVLLDLDVPYALSSDGLTVEGEPGLTLTLSAGVEILGSDGGIDIGDRFPAALVVEGTESAPVIFTSDADSPVPGDWDGLIFFRNCEDSSLSWLQVSYAKSAIRVDCSADIEVSDSSFLYSLHEDLICETGATGVVWSDVTYDTNDGCTLE